jgi:hypothetical protein
LVTVCLQLDGETRSGVYGPASKKLVQELESLKLRLIAMGGSDLAPEGTEALAVRASTPRTTTHARNVTELADVCTSARTSFPANAFCPPP